jgi:hypothetical protein
MLGGATVRHRVAALSSLFEYLCEKNAVTHNPVKGVTRPRAESGEGKTPVLGDHQARDLLVAPGKDTAAGKETVKEKRDRANNMRAGHDTEFFRPVDAGEAHEILNRVFVGAPGVGVGDVGEPFDLGRDIREALKLGGGQEPM